MMLLSPALRYFEAVARAGSVQEAGRRLNVAASAVNRQIINLEAELGAPLFDRLHRGMRLTAAGEALVLEVRRWQTDIQRTRQAIEAMKGLRRGQVTIAAMECFAASLLPEAVATFSERHPGVTVRVRVLGTAGCIEQLAHGEADLALAFNMPQRPSHELMHISCWPIGVVMHPAHPLATQTSISLPECLAHPLALPDETLTLRGVVDALIGRIGLRSTPEYVSNSISAIKAIVAQGRGITFLTRLDIVDELARGTLVQRALEERAMVQDHLCLVAARETASKTLVRSLAGIIAQRIDAFVDADAASDLERSARPLVAGARHDQ